MKYTQVTIKTTTEGSEIVNAQMDMAGAEGVSIEDREEALRYQKTPGEWDYIDEAIFQNMDEEVLVKAYFPVENGDEAVSFLKERIAWLKSQDFGLDLGSLMLSSCIVDETDWANEWKKYYKPFTVGDKLLVKPFWEDAEVGDRILLEMNPGMAFGTGTHETTYMCLEFLEKVVKEGDKVYDVGCGTGILGIAALKLGAKSVLAVDRDVVAVTASKENGELNHVLESMDIRQGDLLKGIEEPADLIIANIIADVIVAFSEDAYKHVKSGGTFIASGIIKDRKDDCVKAIENAGFTIKEIKEKGEWVAIASRRD